MGYLVAGESLRGTQHDRCVESRFLKVLLSRERVAWRGRDQLSPIGRSACQGRKTVTVVPLPFSLVSESEPPCSSASDLTSGRPRPVPLVFLVRSDSTGP